MSLFRRFENFLRRFIGPAQVMDPRVGPDKPLPPRPELIPGGYVRRGTPGNYYIVKTDDADRD